MRTYVQLDLGQQAGAGDQNDDITLDEASDLVVRSTDSSAGTLVKFYASVPVEPERPGRKLA